MEVMNDDERSGDRSVQGNAARYDGERLSCSRKGAFCCLPVFLDRLGLLVDDEWSARRNRKVTRLIRAAQLRFPSACVKGIEYHDGRKLGKALISKLSACTCVWDKHNIIILFHVGKELL